MTYSIQAAKGFVWNFVGSMFLLFILLIAAPEKQVVVRQRTLLITHHLVSHKKMRIRKKNGHFSTFPQNWKMRGRHTDGHANRSNDLSNWKKRIKYDLNWSKFYLLYLNILSTEIVSMWLHDLTGTNLCRNQHLFCGRMHSLHSVRILQNHVFWTHSTKRSFEFLIKIMSFDNILRLKPSEITQDISKLTIGIISIPLAMV